MKLIDILSIIRDGERVVVYVEGTSQSYIFDGKNSIPSELNEREVVSISPELSKNKLWFVIWIKEG